MAQENETKEVRNATPSQAKRLIFETDGKQVTVKTENLNLLEVRAIIEMAKKQFLTE